MSFMCWPDTEHPAYAREAPTIRRLLAEGRYAVQVAQPPKRTAGYFPYSPIDDEVLKVRTLDVKRVTGPAPYVGKPFAYTWKAAVDDLGRWVAGPAEIVYLPPEFP